MTSIPLLKRSFTEDALVYRVYIGMEIEVVGM